MSINREVAERRLKKIDELRQALWCVYFKGTHTADGEEAVWLLGRILEANREEYDILVRLYPEGQSIPQR
jgi:RIO-like serine/threonine protein kinase